MNAVQRVLAWWTDHPASLRFVMVMVTLSVVLQVLTIVGGVL